MRLTQSYNKHCVTIPGKCLAFCCKLFVGLRESREMTSCSSSWLARDEEVSGVVDLLLRSWPGTVKWWWPDTTADVLSHGTDQRRPIPLSSQSSSLSAGGLRATSDHRRCPPSIRLNSCCRPRSLLGLGDTIWWLCSCLKSHLYYYVPRLKKIKSSIPGWKCFQSIPRKPHKIDTGSWLK